MCADWGRCADAARGEGAGMLGWGLLLALLLVCVWAGITVLIAWITGRWPRRL